MTLWSDFLTNDQRTIHKWKHYFPAYEAHFGRFRNRDLVFLEIGCGRGGSLQMWKRYFGPHARIIGIDNRPECADFAEDQIELRIGNQSDGEFLHSVVAEFGPPDVVLDDGSHIMGDVRTSFEFLYPRLLPNSVYLIEDMHTAYYPEYGGGLRTPGSMIEVAKGLLDELNADRSRDALASTEFTRSTLSMHCYPGLLVFEKGRHTTKKAPKIGLF